jgi:uncharacterized RDD family membrane protein YckC
MPGSSNNDGLAELLSKAAQPNIYRINAFRILELYVDCGEMDVTRRIHTIQIAAKTGAAAPAGPGKALPMETPADTFTFTDAVQRLHTPEQRFIDEFFWFWPHDLGNGKSDEALAALRQVNLEQAVEIWTEYANNYSVDNVSVHNMAILSHVSALDLEMQGINKALNESQLKKLDIYWRQAFKRWDSLMGQAGFWKRLEARVCEFGDPRLDSATVQAFRQALPMSLLLINARLAVQAAERKDETGVERHLQTMRIAEFGRTHLSDALVEALEPTRGRVKTFCKTAETQAESDPIHANEAALSLLENCREPLRILDRLIAADTPARDAAHDEVAFRGLECVKTYVDRTDDFRGASAILKKLLSVVVSPSARTRLEEIEKNYGEAANYGNLWCCDGYYDLPEEILTPLEEARQHYNAQEYNLAICQLDDLYGGMSQEQCHLYERFVLKALAKSINSFSIGVLNEAVDWVDHPLKYEDKSKAQTFGGMIRSAERLKEQSRKYLRSIIPEVYNDLLFAFDLDPANHQITDNLESIRGSANTIHMNIPRRTTRQIGKLKARFSQKIVSGEVIVYVGERVVASLPQHFGAAFIDYAILGLWISLMVNLSVNHNSTLLNILGLAPVVLYYPFFYAVVHRTPGELVSKTQVVNKLGKPVSIGMLLLRFLLLGITLGIGFVTIVGLYILPFVPAMNKPHRNLPDLVLGTCLVKVQH